jgi:hypothetical protein
LSRRLRRFCFLHHRSESYRLERPRCRARFSLAEDQHLHGSRRTPVSVLRMVEPSSPPSYLSRFPLRNPLNHYNRHAARCDHRVATRGHTMATPIPPATQSARAMSSRGSRGCQTEEQAIWDVHGPSSTPSISLNCLQILTSVDYQSLKRRVSFGTLSARDNPSTAASSALVARVRLLAKYTSPALAGWRRRSLGHAFGERHRLGRAWGAIGLLPPPN